MKTLKVTLIGTVFGTGLWFSGLAHMIWPPHPMLAVLFLTIAATVGLWYAWPVPRQPGAPPER